MDQRPLTRERIEFNISVLDSPFDTIGVIRDQSAKIYAAVIDNTDVLPDDGENAMGDRVPAYGRKYNTISGMTLNDKKRTRLKKHVLAHIQEEHALWLK
jgi:hypothetical protein